VLQRARSLDKDVLQPSIAETGLWVQTPSKHLCRQTEAQALYEHSLHIFGKTLGLDHISNSTIPSRPGEQLGQLGGNICTSRR
jgi:hypothetical protein